ncbi:MAG: sodium:calcium antiporter [Planctomycetes bacterium]|nr:sodium:calcium antiporter [Planctomycetota bacterium]
MNDKMKHTLWMLFALGLAVQFSAIRIFHLDLGPGWAALWPGLAVFGAAFLLSWAAELAQLEIPQTLAIAFLALIAVVPEYAVDVLLAWKAGTDPSYLPRAAANMTGSNRLLIGVGWPIILFAYWWKTRKTAIELPSEHGLEIKVLLIATVYSFIFAIKQSFTIIDTFILLGIFIYYMVCAAKMKHEEPELEGPAKMLAVVSRPCRILITIGLFILAGFVIFNAAEPFVEGLIHTGKVWGISDFLLIQWLAPLASESPEFIVAIIFALRANPVSSLGTLISSKINQWTLLIATLPMAYGISTFVAYGSFKGMALDHQQVQEVFLTSAQSFFALVLLANFRFAMVEALALIVLFSGQLIWQIAHTSDIHAGGTHPEYDKVRMGFAFAYVVFGLAVIMFHKGRRCAVKKMLFRKHANT